MTEDLRKLFLSQDLREKEDQAARLEAERLEAEAKKELDVRTGGYNPLHPAAVQFAMKLEENMQRYRRLLPFTAAQMSDFCRREAMSKMGPQFGGAARVVMVPIADVIITAAQFQTLGGKTTYDALRDMLRMFTKYSPAGSLQCKDMSPPNQDYRRLQILRDIRDGKRTCPLRTDTFRNGIRVICTEPMGKQRQADFWLAYLVNELPEVGVMLRQITQASKPELEFIRSVAVGGKYSQAEPFMAMWAMGFLMALSGTLGTWPGGEEGTIPLNLSRNPKAPYRESMIRVMSYASATHSNDYLALARVYPHLGGLLP